MALHLPAPGLIDKSSDTRLTTYTQSPPSPYTHSYKNMIETRPRRPPSHTLLLLPFLLLLTSLLTSTTAFLSPFPSSSSPSPFSHTRTCRQADTYTHTRTATANPQEVEKKEGKKEGATLTLGVFIEHTDRYGMMYHSNYLLFLSRM